MRLWLPLIAVSALASCAPAKRSSSGFVADPRPPRPAPSQIVADTSPAPPPRPEQSTDPIYGQKREIMIALIKESRDPDEKADLLMRLADLEQEMVDAAEARIVEILERCGDVGCGSADRERLARLEAVKQRHVDEQAAWLDRLVREYETYFRADEALFRLGALLLEHQVRHLETELAWLDSVIARLI